jgi:hypothetical protein
VPTQIKLLTLADVCKTVKRSQPYIRALADASLIDSYILESGWRGFPKQAIQQIRDHEAQKAKTLEA